jgi:hypothetical protein
MSVKLAVLRKSLLTHVAQVGFCARVDQHVALQMVPLGKFTLAYRTIMGLYTGVELHMRIQITLLRKWFLAYGADVTAFVFSRLL